MSAKRKVDFYFRQICSLQCRPEMSLLKYTRLAFKKRLEPSHGVLQFLECFYIAFAEATLFSVSCASRSEYFCFVLVNDLYIGDPLEANKTYSSKTR